MKKVVTIFLMVAMIASCVFAQGSEEKTKDEVIKIMLTCSNTAGKPHTDALIAACEEIAKRTDNKVQIEFHGGDEMFTHAEGVEAVMNNANVMYIVDASTFKDYCAPLSTLIAPFLFENYQQVEAFVATDFWKSIIKESEAAGLHLVVDDLVLGTRNILATKPVLGVADCKDLNIRIPDDPMYIAIFDALGSNYLAMSASDMVTAMSTGMCDSMEGTAASCLTYLKSIKNPCYSLNGHILSVVSVFCGQGFWEDLPENYKTIISEEFNKAAQKSNRQYAEQFEDYLKKYEAEGCKVYRLTDAQKAEFVKASTPYAQSLPRYNDFKKIVDNLKY